MTTLARSRIVLMVRTPPLAASMASKRVADDVEENLHQLISIAANARENGFELQFDARGPGAQVERAKLHSIVDHGVDVQERAFGGNLARETQKIADERFCAASLVANF